MDYIDSQIAKINIAKEKISKQISSLEEYRTRLISDVVTGQIDVREVLIPEYTPEEDIITEENEEIEEGEVAEDAE